MSIISIGINAKIDSLGADSFLSLIYIELLRLETFPNKLIPLSKINKHFGWKFHLTKKQTHKLLLDLHEIGLIHYSFFNGVKIPKVGE